VIGLFLLFIDKGVSNVLRECKLIQPPQLDGLGKATQSAVKYRDRSHRNIQPGMKMSIAMYEDTSVGRSRMIVSRSIKTSSAVSSAALIISVASNIDLFIVGGLGRTTREKVAVLVRDYPGSATCP